MFNKSMFVDLEFYENPWYLKGYQMGWVTVSPPMTYYTIYAIGEGYGESLWVHEESDEQSVIGMRALACRCDVRLL
jgi:hypothetical protein